MMYLMPIYAALVLGLIGLRSPFWRLHATMAALSLFTLYAVSYFFTRYHFAENSTLVGAFCDSMFGSVVTLVMVKCEHKRNVSRLYLYYAIILSMFFFTSMLNIIAWGMGQAGVYDGSYLAVVFNQIILSANIIQVACLIEGGKNGLSNIIAYIHDSLTGPDSVRWNKTSHDKSHKEE